jgi:hypothetical protein
MALSQIHSFIEVLRAVRVMGEYQVRLISPTNMPKRSQSRASYKRKSKRESPPPYVWAKSDIQAEANQVPKNGKNLKPAPRKGE